MGELKPPGKPFDISKWEVQEAYLKVKANKGAPGVDEVTLAEFEKDLKNNLYKIWNRMSSGSYFPPPVKAVEIPKPHGSGTRILGVPTVADRIAQTVVAARLEKAVEPVFHPDSYGYRPGRSALDAVAACRKRCWKKDWVIDLDVEKFFDSVQWDLIIKAVQAHTGLPWVVLYVRRWLAAPLQLPDGSLLERDRGTPQGGLCSAEHNEPLGYSVNRSKILAWRSRAAALTTRGRPASSRPGSALMRTAWTTWSGCAGLAVLPARRAGVPEAGGSAMAGMSALAATGAPR